MKGYTNGSDEEIGNIRLESAAVEKEGKGGGGLMGGRDRGKEGKRSEGDGEWEGVKQDGAGVVDILEVDLQGGGVQ